MQKIKVKPLAVRDTTNTFCTKCRTSKHVRRTKTTAYKHYSDLVALLIKPLKITPKRRLKLILEFGFSSKGSDWDNPIKPFQDILQKKLGFNDNMVYEAEIKKKIVKKGEEYIKYEIIELL